MIAITGATSRLAFWVIKDLLKRVRRERLLLLTRKAKKGFVQTDYSREDLSKKLRNARIVLHFAGRVFGDKREIWKANVELTEELVNSLPKKAKLFFSSSIAVYGKNVRANEYTKINPDTFYARTKARAEQIVSSFPNSVIFRIGTLYGENFEEYLKVLKLIKRGICPVLGKGNNLIPLTYVKDVSKAIAHSVFRRKNESIYLLASPSYPQKHVFELAANLLKVKPFFFHIPVSFALLLSKLNFNSTKFLDKELILSLSSNREFFPKNSKKIGFSPTPLEKGIKSVINFWKRNSKL